MSMLNVVPFISVDSMLKLVLSIGVERFLVDLADDIERDFRRWPDFEKSARLASHSTNGVIELMPTSDGTTYSFKYVNGHPSNPKSGRQTVTAFGVLADVESGYPALLSEMTLLTALRTAATSALAARYLAPDDARCMALIGNGAQAEFQAIAFKAILGIREVKLFDVDPAATRKCSRNLKGFGLKIVECMSVEEAIQGAQIITTVTADKKNATILSDNHVGEGIHINAIGGDCPGKTELHPDILHRSDIFVEYTPQTRIEGEIQQVSPDHPVTELWEVIAGQAKGRINRHQITLFDSVGFAVEDLSALRYVRREALRLGLFSELDLLANPDAPQDLFGLVVRAGQVPRAGL